MILYLLHSLDEVSRRASLHYPPCSPPNVRANSVCSLALLGAWSTYVSMAGSLHFGRGVLLRGGVFIFDVFLRRGLLTSIFEIIIL